MATTVRGQVGAVPQVESTEAARALRTLRLVRRVFLIALFGASIAAGVWLYGVINPPIDYGSLPPLHEAAEPVAADKLTDLVVAGNEADLAESYSGELLQAVSLALTVGGGGQPQPLVEVRDIQYLGSVVDGSDTLALYVALGRLDGGIEAAAGFALRVRDGQVVGVN